MNVRGKLQGFGSALLVVVVVGAIYWLPGWSAEAPHSVSRVTQRLDKLEAEQRRIGTVLSSIASDVGKMETRGERSAAKLAELMPAGALWVPLKVGGNAQWNLGDEGRGRVEFLRIDSGASGEVPVFRVSHRAGQIEVGLTAGQTMRAVDDRGSIQVAYLTTMHRLRLDRSGVLEAAMLSISIER